MMFFPCQDRMLPEHRTGPVINQLDSPTYILVSGFSITVCLNILERQKAFQIAREPLAPARQVLITVLPCM